MIPAPPPTLVQSLRRGRCILFAGSGLSAWAGLPDWSKLLRGLIDELRAETPDDPALTELSPLLAKGRYLEVAEYIKDRIGRDALAECLRRGLSAEPSELPAPHQRLGRISFAGIVTTNFDRLLERALPSAIVATQVDQAQLGSIVRGEGAFILKAHGDILRPETLVLAATDYRELVFSNATARETLRTLLNANTILFIGYSISDPDFRLLLDEHASVFGEYGAARYALITGTTLVERTSLRNVARVEVLPYDEHTEIVTFLDLLCDELAGPAEDIRVEAEPMVPAIDPRQTVRASVEPAAARTPSELIAQFEQAGADETESLLLARQPPAFEAALAEHLGTGRLERLREQARHRRRVREERERRPVVILIPGFLASELSVIGARGSHSKVWIDPFRLLAGGFDRLAYRSDSDEAVDATGVIMQGYRPLIARLADNWDLRVFPYDWRLGFRDVAKSLRAFIDRELGPSPQCHLVAHGTGGLVARAFARAYPDLWQRLWDDRSGTPGARGGRLILLGTPNHGYFTTLLLLTGEQPLVQKVGKLDLRHSVQEISAIFATFPSIYEMFPSPVRDPDWTRFYEREFFTGWVDVSEPLLDAARSFHEYIAPAVDARRMASIIGRGQRTVSGYDGSSAEGRPVWLLSNEGDGITPVHLGVLGAGDDTVPTWIAEEPHGVLTTAPRVISAIEDILRSGQTGVLPRYRLGAATISPEEKLAVPAW